MKETEVIYDNGNSVTKVTNDGELISITQHIYGVGEGHTDNISLYHDEAEILYEILYEILSKTSRK